MDASLHQDDDALAIRLIRSELSVVEKTDVGWTVQSVIALSGFYPAAASFSP